MFTGIVSGLGRVMTAERGEASLRLRLGAGDLDLSDATVGESVAVNGVCLTVTFLRYGEFDVDVSAETLARTTLGHLEAGSPVNLERALRLSDRLGGHMMTGHVDGIGEVAECNRRGDYMGLQVRAPEGLLPYITEKGSIAVDGVSLTVNGVEGSNFACQIIPHTLKSTMLGDYRPGSRVNLEVDLVARYLARLARFGQ
jgi:riboflavin synthase